jgi:hypothetical protein
VGPLSILLVSGRVAALAYNSFATGLYVNAATRERGMAQPILQIVHTGSILMMHRCKRLAEPMQNPMPTNGIHFAGHGFLPDNASAMAAIEPSGQGAVFEHSQQMTLGIAIRIRE